MLNYLNGVETEIGKIFGKRKAKKQEMLVKKRALIKKAIAKKNVTSQVQKANILNKAIKKASLVKKASPLTITRIKKQAVIDMNRKNFEEEGEPIVTELPMPILETANDKFDEGLEEIQEPENLNPDEADSDEGGEEIGRIGKGKLKKRLQKSKAKFKQKTKNLGQKVRKYTPIIALARGSFLTLLKFNVFKLRNKIAEGYKKNPRKIENWWVGTWGGDLNVLLKNLKVSKIGQIGEPVTIATAIVSASGVLVSIIEVLKSMTIKVDKNDNTTGEEELTSEEEATEEQTPIEDNADIGVYYPQYSVITKKPKKTKKQSKPKSPKNKGDNLKKFQNVTDKTQNILNITKSAVDKIFKGKKPTKEAKALVNIKKEDVKTKTTNNKLLIGGGIGLLALLFLMKKK